MCASADVDMPKVDEGLTDPFETIFAKRGEVQKRSGSKKLVSHIFISILGDRDSSSSNFVWEILAA